jgi:hypothetical protein
LPVPALISKAVFNSFCAVVASPVAPDKATKALVRSPPALPVASASLSINCPINGAANPKLTPLRAFSNSLASFCASLNVLDTALPNAKTAVTLNTAINLLLRFFVLLPSFCVAVSACLNAFLPVNSEPIFIATSV